MSIPDVAQILRHIAEQYGITPEDILGHSHSQEYVEPRHEAFAVVYELNRYTLAELGRLFDKTSNGIAYGLKRHYERLRLRGPGRDW
jgi:chromosomal replication initiation ATPase DnaA